MLAARVVTSAATVKPISADTLLWPQPTTSQNGNVSIRLSSRLQFHLEGRAQDSELVQSAADRYLELLEMDRINDCNNDIDSAGIQNVILRVKEQVDEHDLTRMSESYSISVPLDGPPIIEATSPLGILRGLETFSQLVHQCHIVFAPWNIEDTPTFSHRGISLDTARHFIPADDIRNVIDAMSYAKLSVLHWHIVDSQSFPFESKAVPELNLGAYSSVERYSQDEIRDLIKFAHLRGVRVIPEFGTFKILS